MVDPIDSRGIDNCRTPAQVPWTGQQKNDPRPARSLSGMKLDPALEYGA
ncbi:hypothetical protein [Dokdonella soli]